MRVAQGNADGDILEVIKPLDRRLLLDADGTACMVIRAHEVNGFQPLGGNGHRGNDSVILLGQQPGDNAVKRCGDNFYIHAQTLGECFTNGGVETDNFIPFIGETERRVLATHCHAQYF